MYREREKSINTIITATRPSAAERNKEEEDAIEKENAIKSAHELALIPCGIKAGILHRGQVESCQAFVLERLPLLLLNR